MPTPDEIADAAALAAEEGVQSASVDGNSATALDPMKMLDVADRIAARTAAAASGGCGWSGLAKSRVIPGGATS